MTQVQQYNQPYVPYPMPINNQPVANTMAYNNGQQGTVSVSTPNGASQIYQYPTTSVYDPNAKQGANGVNIYIYNPSAIGGPSSNSVANASYPIQGQPPTQQYYSQTVPSQPIANTPINSTEEKDKAKKKPIVQLTDNYIKTLESYLRSGDANVRKSAIVDLIKRFEEEPSRYENPQLTALLNIALQDPNPSNRMLAMSPISSENAHGDDNTIELLKILQQSDKLYGQEAKMANESLLKASQSKQIQS